MAGMLKAQNESAALVERVSRVPLIPCERQDNLFCLAMGLLSRLRASEHIAGDAFVHLSTLLGEALACACVTTLQLVCLTASSVAALIRPTVCGTSAG